VRQHVEEVVRSSVEETLNGLLEAEADELCGRSDTSEARAVGHPIRTLRSKTGNEGRRGDVEGASTAEPALRDPDHRALQATEASVEEAMIEMYLAGVSVRRWRTSRRRCGHTGQPST